VKEEGQVGAKDVQSWTDARGDHHQNGVAFLFCDPVGIE